jgi:hypothetical protein
LQSQHYLPRDKIPGGVVFEVTENLRKDLELIIAGQK